MLPAVRSAHGDILTRIQRVALGWDNSKNIYENQHVYESNRLPDLPWAIKADLLGAIKSWSHQKAGLGHCLGSSSQLLVRVVTSLIKQLFFNLPELGF